MLLFNNKKEQLNLQKELSKEKLLKKLKKKQKLEENQERDLLGNINNGKKNTEDKSSEEQTAMG